MLQSGWLRSKGSNIDDSSRIGLWRSKCIRLDFRSSISFFPQILGTVMHEIGHTLGYIHTQSRVDRNSFVNVITSNIAEDYLGNFFIWSFGTMQFADVSLPYDYSSLMHYNGYGFTTNGQPTITTVDPRYELTIGQREVATFYDYKSDVHWQRLSEQWLPRSSNVLAMHLARWFQWNLLRST